MHTILRWLRGPPTEKIGRGLKLAALERERRAKERRTEARQREREREREREKQKETDEEVCASLSSRGFVCNNLCGETA